MAERRFEVVTLHNGDRAIRGLESGEVMHPSVGPWAEARTLYVEQTRLADRLREESDVPLRLYDVGLGGGANAVAALTCWRELGVEARRPLELISFEAYLEAMELAIGEPEGFPFLAPWKDAAVTLLREGEWREANVTWRLLHGDARAKLAEAPPSPELVFFDPFSPEKNTEMWTPDAFARLRERCSAEGRGTLLVTYSSSTRTRVSMLLGGFFVGVGEAIGTKRETTVAATRRELLERPLEARWLERFSRSSARAPWGADTLDAAGEARILGHAQFR